MFGVFSKILLLACVLWTAPALTLKPNQDITRLGSEMEILRDSTHELTQEDIRSGQHDAEFFKRFPVFPVRIPPGQHTFYFWTRTTSSTPFPLTISLLRLFEERAAASAGSGWRRLKLRPHPSLF